MRSGHRLGHLLGPRLGRGFGWLWGAYGTSALGTWLAFGAFPLIAIRVLHSGPAEVGEKPPGLLTVTAGRYGAGRETGCRRDIRPGPLGSSSPRRRSEELRPAPLLHAGELGGQRGL